MKQRIFLLFIFICHIAISSRCNSISNLDIYDFEFNRLKNNNSPWHIFGDNFIILSDSTNLINGKIPILIKNRDDSKVFDHTIKNNSFIISQFIKIESPISDVRISLDSRSLNYDNLSMVLYCLDKNEEVIAKDSIQILSNDNWIKSRLKIEHIDNIELLCIEIKGSASFLNLNENESKLWLDKISLCVDSLNILQLNQENNNQENLLDSASIIFLSQEDKNDLNRIPDFNNHKIIAFGESIHGSETVNCLVFNCIRELIENEKCKVVLLEYYFSEVMLWNLYVQGLTQIQIDSLFVDQAFLYSPNVLKEFLVWLKDYNLHTNEKVNIVGIDIGSKMQESRGIFECIENMSVKNEILDSLLFFTSNTKFADAIKLINNNEQLKDILGNNQYNILKQSFYYYGELGYYPNFNNYISIRDSAMWLNAKFALGNLLKNDSEKVVLYSHISHANKMYSLPINFKKSLGNYLNNNFGSQYYVVGVFAGMGTYTTWHDTILTTENYLSVPPIGSLENQLMKINNEFFFVPLTHQSSIQLMRFQGAAYNDLQFSFGSISRRMDGCFFIRKSNGFSIPSTWPKTRNEVAKQSRRETRRLFDYKALKMNNRWK